MKTIINRDHVTRARATHHEALERIFNAHRLKSGLQIWRALRKIECDASRGAVAYCNGDHTRVAGLNLDFRADGSEAWEQLRAQITSRVEKCLGVLPAGFFVNGDPRGYALKIDPDKGTVPPGMHKDWGGYGILAPEIN